MGYNALSDSTAGLKISNGKVEIQGQSSKMLLSSQGIRQIYAISMADQIDSSYSLSIPIYIPKNADGSDVSSGTARIIVKAEKFRAYSKAVSAGGSYLATRTSSSGGSYSSSVTSSSGGSSSSTTGSDGSHSHAVSGSTDYKSGHTHSISEGSSYTGSSGGHDHSFSSSTGYTGTHTHYFQTPNHTHSVKISISSHTHNVDIDLPSHTHPIDFGIYESANTATITVSKGTSSWAVTTGNKLDVSNIAISDGETINISANNLARVQAYIFVEYFLY